MEKSEMHVPPSCNLIFQQMEPIETVVNIVYSILFNLKLDRKTPIIEFYV